MAERTLVVWQYIEKDNQSRQYNVNEPTGDHVDSPTPLYLEPSVEGAPAYAYRHTVIEKDAKDATPDIHMTIYSPSASNPWEGTGETTTDALYP